MGLQVIFIFQLTFVCPLQWGSFCESERRQAHLVERWCTRCCRKTSIVNQEWCEIEVQLLQRLLLAWQGMRQLHPAEGASPILLLPINVCNAEVQKTFQFDPSSQIRQVAA